MRAAAVSFTEAGLPITQLHEAHDYVPVNEVDAYVVDARYRKAFLAGYNAAVILHATETRPA